MWKQMSLRELFLLIAVIALLMPYVVPVLLPKRKPENVVVSLTRTKPGTKWTVADLLAIPDEDGIGKNLRLVRPASAHQRERIFPIDLNNPETMSIPVIAGDRIVAD
jgi:hypothetical protein